MFKPALNITDQIADYLAELIIFGDIASGARIQEIRLAKALGVSRGSVREALLILERRHLITVVPRRGAHVNDLSLADMVEILEIVAALELRWYRELLRCPDRAGILREAACALSGLEEAAKAGDVRQSLRFRRDYYALMLKPASRYTEALFESVLPSSQRILHALMREADVDQYDLARYYRALHGALEAEDPTRLEELTGAFSKRATGLAAKVHLGRQYSGDAAMASRWPDGQFSDSGLTRGVVV